LIEAGLIKDVRKELMGHSRNEDTNDRYSHIELPICGKQLKSWSPQVQAEILLEKFKNNNKIPG
jgi:hypothetical protein